MPAPRKPLTDAQRQARKMNNALPEVRARKAVRRAIKNHRTMPAPPFQPGKMLRPKY